MSVRWTLKLLCVALVATATCVLAQTAATPTQAQAQAQPAAVVTPRPSVQPVPAVTPVVVVPSIPGKAAPHVQAVAVAKMYSDDYDEDEDNDDDLPLRPAPASAAAPAPGRTQAPKRSVSIDERIAEQKHKIEQLKELLAKQREKHAATAQLIAQRNKQIQQRMRKHAAEMAKAANIQRRRDALTRAERAEKARKAAAKRAAEIRAKQQVYALQKQLAQQHQAAALAQRALIRQQQEDAIRQRVMSSQHETYEQLEAELQAHEQEWANRNNKLRKLKNKIKTTPKRMVRKPPQRRPLFRRVTITPRLQNNPFIRVTPNPSWFPRRRLLTPRIRRWLVVRIIRRRRATPPPTRLPSITIARRRYLQARAQARTTLRGILQKRQCKRGEARRAFRKLSRDLAITATLAQQALIRATSQTPKFIFATKVPTRIKRRPLIRRPFIIRRRPFRGRSTRIKRRPIRRFPAQFQFKLSENPYPKFVSTRDATSSAPRTVKLAELTQEITKAKQE